ncbi:transthyretin-like family domain-containing protein [Ditylenchus destructor]|nr:transthyretin-like family domain-containing protein [Ditylenchus destructor]
MKVILCLLSIVLIILLSASESLAKVQNITVKGQVICDKRSMRNVRVELREHDTFDPDDALNETHSDKDGYFNVFGTEDEIQTIKPYIRLTHTCDVTNKATCSRITDFDLPEDKIGTVYDMNFVNLNLRGNRDSETCT